MKLLKLSFTFLMSFTLLVNSSYITFAGEGDSTDIDEKKSKAEEIIGDIVSGDDKKIQGEDFLDLLLLIGLTFNSLSYGKECMGTSAISTYIAMASAITFVAGEIVANIAYQNKLDTIEELNSAPPAPDDSTTTPETTPTTTTEIDDSTKPEKRYELLRDALIAKKEVVETKKTWTEAAEIGYLNALAMAIVEAILRALDKHDGTCKNYTSTDDTSGGTDASGGTNSKAKLMEQGKVFFIPKTKSHNFQELERYKTMISNSTNNVDSYFLFKEITSFYEGKKISPTHKLYDSFKTTYNTLDDSLKNISFRDSILLALSFINPIKSASAFSLSFDDTSKGYMTILGMGVITAKYWKIVKKILDKTVNKLVETPGKRIVLHVLEAGLVTWDIKILKNKIEDTEEQIVMVNKLITAVRAQSRAGGLDYGDGTDPYANRKVKPLEYKTIPDLADDGCIGRNGQIVSCKDCRTKNSCNKLPPLTTPKNLKLPDLITKATNDISSTANSLMSGNTAAANTTAANMQTYGASIKKLNKELEKKLNDQRAKDKLPPLNIDEITKKNLGTLRGAMQKAFGSSLSSMGVISPSTKDAKKEDEKAKTGKIETGTKESVGKTESPGTQKKDEDINLDFALDEGLSGDAAMLPSDEAVLQAMENLDVNDIRKNKEGSIFKAISNRYLISYPKLLEEVKNK